MSSRQSFPHCPPCTAPLHVHQSWQEVKVLTAALQQRYSEKGWEAEEDEKGGRRSNEEEVKRRSARR